MNKQLVSIGLAIFCGAYAGGFIALEAGKYFWWIGALAGVCIGYVAYNPSEVLQVIVQTTRAKLKESRLPLIMEWFFWGGVKGGTLSASAFFFVASILLLVGVPLGIIKVTVADGGSITLFLTKFMLLIWLIGLVVGLVFGSVGHACCAIFPDDSNTEKYGDGKLRSESIEILKTCNVVTVLFWLLPRLLYAVTREFLRFVGTVYVLIHSESRRLCGVYAGIGATLGYLQDHVVLGACLGVLAGLLNYELISKRLLKIAA